MAITGLKPNICTTFAFIKAILANSLEVGSILMDVSDKNNGPFSVNIKLVAAMRVTPFAFPMMLITGFTTEA